MKPNIARGFVKAVLGALSPRMAQWLRAAVRRPRPRLGAGSYVDRSVHFLGADNVAIGPHAVISEGTVFNVNHRAEGGTAIVVGHHAFVGRRNFFSSGAVIELRPYVLTAIDCKFLGSSHIIDNPNAPVISTGTTAHWSIRVGANTFMGAGSAVLGSVTIGHGCVIGSMALVTTHVPPFSMVMGNPARVVKRYSFSQRQWIPAENYTSADEAANPGEAAYLQTLEAEFGNIPMPYAAAGRNMGHL